ncbi:hypothetical protein EDB19DRAFT_1950834 [Suillus lakei]|nr:hypothetical protein EDB19DRAFT_1950834 [Suillus lakei]
MHLFTTSLHYIFIVLKCQWRILQLPLEYKMDIQAHVPDALCALHNFICRFDSNIFDEEADDLLEYESEEGGGELNELGDGPADAPERWRANNHHDNITRADVGSIMCIQFLSNLPLFQSLEPPEPPADQVLLPLKPMDTIPLPVTPQYLCTPPHPSPVIWSYRSSNLMSAPALSNLQYSTSHTGLHPLHASSASATPILQSLPFPALPSLFLDDPPPVEPPILDSVPDRTLSYPQSLPLVE